VTVEEELSGIVERFNRHVDRTPSVREEIGGLTRTVAVRLTDGESYAVDLADAHLGNLRKGAVPKADLTITTDTATLRGLLSREIGPMKALVTRKLTIDGSLEDKLLFRKLL
jgi:putative sterol carrier protein